MNNTLSEEFKNLNNQIKLRIKYPNGYIDNSNCNLNTNEIIDGKINITCNLNEQNYNVHDISIINPDIQIFSGSITLYFYNFNDLNYL